MVEPWLKKCTGVKPILVSHFPYTDHISQTYPLCQLLCDISGLNVLSGVASIQMISFVHMIQDFGTQVFRAYLDCQSIGMWRKERLERHPRRQR